MPNDAKLGLLVGVVGVIFVAVMSGNRLPRPQTAANVPSSVQKTVNAKPAEKTVVAVVSDVKPEPVHEPIPEPHEAPAVLPMELASTPVVRTKREPVATPTSRTRGDDDLEP